MSLPVGVAIRNTSVKNIQRDKVPNSVQGLGMGCNPIMIHMVLCEW